MEHLDRIAESYAGALGETFQKKSQQRIDWICEKVHGKSVLDIGCSQGICEILLGRRGIHVTGVDIAEESIAFAQNSLHNEPLEVQQNVTLICADFLHGEKVTGTYDTVLMTEILEHLEEPVKMVEKAMKYLCDGGKVIVTVPFGINDFPDHKHTFYMVDIYEMLAPWVVVDEIKFMGAWIGFCGRKSAAGADLKQIDIELLRREEKAFFGLEKPLQDKVTLLTEKYKKTEENYQSMKGLVQGRNEQLNRLKEKLEKATSEKLEVQKKAEEQFERLELAKKNELKIMAQAKDTAMQQAIDRIYRETEAGVGAWRKQEEERFQMLESHHREVLNDARCVYDALSREHNRVQMELTQSKQLCCQLKEQNVVLQQQLRDSEKDNGQLTQTVADCKTQIERMQEQLIKTLGELEREERLLVAVKQQILQMDRQLQQVKEKNQIYEEKLHKVYGTWYGRIVLKCYKLLRKIKNAVIRK